MNVVVIILMIALVGFAAYEGYALVRDILKRRKNKKRGEQNKDLSTETENKVDRKE